MVGKTRRPYPGRRIEGKIFYPKWGATTRAEADERAEEFREEGYWARVVREKIEPNTIFRRGISYTVFVRHKVRGGLP